MAVKRCKKERFKGASDLLLGWRAEPESRMRMGFGASPSSSVSEGNRDESRAITMSDDGHIITVAPTGAGKGRGAIIPNLLRYQGPVIVVDPKGENCRVTARARRAMGHDVRIIDPFEIGRAHV